MKLTESLRVMVHGHKDEHGHTPPGGHHMHDESDRHSPAQAELRRRLDEGRAAARLGQTQLAAKAGLSRTTVSKALSPRGGVPSVDTVTALAKALRLPIAELLQLRRTAAGPTDAPPADVPGPGQPIGQWEPHELEVHPAGPGPAAASPDGVRALPGYVRREHDRVLADVVTAAGNGRSGIVVLVGTSSTGKTRACWEAVQPLAEKGWKLWHPVDPTWAEAALEDLHRVGPRTVVWLNEAQHYLGDRQYGERIAAAVHQLLVNKERGPVLVLGTLWPEFAQDYTALPEADRNDPHSRARKLLAGRTVSVPDTFDAPALAAASALAAKGDVLLADALSRASSHGRLAQDLAGAPELLRRLLQGSAVARALLEAAMDARRLGAGLHLPPTFLTRAALGYLSEHDYEQLDHHWAEAAFKELAQPVHGKQAPLRRVGPRPPSHQTTLTCAGSTDAAASRAGAVFRLADYLEHHGRTMRSIHFPPAEFWEAAAAHLQADEHARLALSVQQRGRYRLAASLYCVASQAGHAEAVAGLLSMRRYVGEQEGLDDLYRVAALAGDRTAILELALQREAAGDREGAERVHRKAHTKMGLQKSPLAQMRESAGDHAGAERLALEAGLAGSSYVVRDLARARRRAGNAEGAEQLLRTAVEAGILDVLPSLGVLREDAGAWEEAERLYTLDGLGGPLHLLEARARVQEKAGNHERAEQFAFLAADEGNAGAIMLLVRMREESGRSRAAERLAVRAAAHGLPYFLLELARMREDAGELADAIRLCQMAADSGPSIAVQQLTQLHEHAGRHEAAEHVAHRTAQDGDPLPALCLARIRDESGNRAAAQELYEMAAGAGSAHAMERLADWHKEDGNIGEAERLYHRAAKSGAMAAVAELALLREAAGDPAEAERLVRQAAGAGYIDGITRLALVREAAGRPDEADRLALDAARRGYFQALTELGRQRVEAGRGYSAAPLYVAAANVGLTNMLPQLAESRGQSLDDYARYGIDLDGQLANPWPWPTPTLPAPTDPADGPR
ncbi:helix-turn-helix domain-containing protein [Streptomyces sp. JV178]|uniref:helix-turn-helix domain-containing protein n=1 Tax=Streptomyces sp. JV178 TaxID=858632 RepID=UPI0015D53533|nr:helix-turn-helix domain-containing protein [Streptomyces sp. JV178]